MRRIYAGVSASSKPGIIGWVQRRLRGAEYTHAYHAFDLVEANGPVRRLVIHSIGIGSIVQTWETFKEHRTRFAEYEILVTEERYRTFVDQAFRDSGRYPYSRRQNVGMVIAFMFGLKRNPLDRGKVRQVCSESAARRAADTYSVSFPMSYDLVWPTDFLEAHEKLEADHSWCRLVAGTLYERRQAA